MCIYCTQDDQRHTGARLEGKVAIGSEASILRIDNSRAPHFTLERARGHSSDTYRSCYRTCPT